MHLPSFGPLFTTHPELAPTPQSVGQIESMIRVVTGKKKAQYKEYAQSIAAWSKHYKVDPRVVVAIIMTESSFNQSAVSYTGDVGLGQVNPQIWKKEFRRMGEKLDVPRLSNDYDYNIQKTVQILSLMRSDSDELWIAKYHSNTPIHKIPYYASVTRKMNKISKSNRVVAAAESTSATE